MTVTAAHRYALRGPWYEQERQGVLTVQPEDLGPFAAQMRALMRREHGKRWEYNEPAGWLAALWRDWEREPERKRAWSRGRTGSDPAE